MELIVTILCTMSGALIGTAIAILLMLNRIQPPAQAELDTMRGHLRTAESSLAEATTAAENLRKQIAERDRTIHESAEELNEKQRQLGFAIAEAEKAAAERSAAEQKAHEVTAEAAEITARRDADGLRVQELGGEVARLTTECAELQAQLVAELQRSAQLTGQIAELQSDRQSAAKGIELLLMAQQNLSRFAKPVCEDVPLASPPMVLS